MSDSRPLRDELERTQAQLAHARNQLEENQAQLETTRAELMRAQAQLRSLEEQLATRRGEFKLPAWLVVVVILSLLWLLRRVA